MVDSPMKMSMNVVKLKTDSSFSNHKSKSEINEQLVRFNRLNL